MREGGRLKEREREREGGEKQVCQIVSYNEYELSVFSKLGYDRNTKLGLFEFYSYVFYLSIKEFSIG